MPLLQNKSVVPLQSEAHLFGRPFPVPSSQLSSASMTLLPQKGVVMSVQMLLHMSGFPFCAPLSHCSVLSFVLSPQRGSSQSERQASGTAFALQLPPSRKQDSC